ASLPSYRAELTAVYPVADKCDHEEHPDEEVDALIQETIEIHMTDEESIFFPALEPFLPQEVAAAREEHEAIRRAYASLPGSDRTAGIKSVLQQLLQHIEAEEQNLYDRAEDLLGAERLRELQSHRHACSCRGHYV